MKNLLKTMAASSLMLSAALVPQKADACSRVMYEGADSLYVVGRSLDWKTPIPTNLYVYPRGVEKVSSDQPGALRWRSRYGAVYAVGYDGGITEGMNEKGLLVNGLFCKGTIYVNERTSDRPPMSLAMFVGWLLDNFSTTDECVAELKKQDFTISGATFDGGTVSALHWGITDPTGKTVILEFDNGNVRLFEGDDILVLTNDPAWPQMQAINDYWKKVGGQNMLPGTVKSPDRYVRGDYFTRHVKKTDNPDTAVSICRSILANVSVPYLYAIETEPNVSSTQWRSYANLRDHRYYFDIVTNLGIYYVDLDECNLREGAPILRLDTSDTFTLIGNALKSFKRHPGFTPMY